MTPTEQLLRDALLSLYTDTIDYIQRNNLAGAHCNQSVKQAHYALAATDAPEFYAAPLPAQPQGQGAEAKDGVLLTDCVEYWSKNFGSGYFFISDKVTKLYAAPPSQAPEPAQPRNFCPDCGKRSAGGIHTCSPQYAVEKADAAQQEATGAEEPVGYLHRHGNHAEVSERRLEEGEIVRGWTQEPLYTAPPPAQSQAPVAYVNDMGIGRALSWQPLKESFGHRALVYVDAASLPSPAPLQLEQPPCTNEFVADGCERFTEEPK